MITRALLLGNSAVDYDHSNYVTLDTGAKLTWIRGSSSGRLYDYRKMSQIVFDSEADFNFTGMPVKEIHFNVFSNATPPGNGFYLKDTWKDCTMLDTVEFPNLTILGNYGLWGIFNGCVNLKELRFPALTTINMDSEARDPEGFYEDAYHFGIEGDYMCQGCSGIQIRFPRTLQPIITKIKAYNKAFGITSGNVTFDL